MKNIKKLTAVIITFLLLISVSALPASAASIFDRIDDVSFVSAQEITIREIDEYKTYLEEAGQHTEITEDDYQYIVEVFLDVTLSSGEVIECNDFYNFSEDGKRYVGVYSYIDIRDFDKAVENGETKVPVYYDIELYSQYDIKLDSISGQGEASIIECYIRNLTPVSGYPEVVQEVSPYQWMIDSYFEEESDTEYVQNIEGAVFDIEYPDGSIKRAAVEIQETEHGAVFYALDGKPIYYSVNYNEEMFVIEYLDIVINIPVEVIHIPIEAVVIDEVIVSDDFEAETVSFTLTMTDGSEESLEVDFTTDESYMLMGSFPIYIAETKDGYPILVFLYEHEGNEYPVRSYINVMVDVNGDISDEAELEGPAQEDTLLNRLIYRIRLFFVRIFEFFYYFP